MENIAGLFRAHIKHLKNNYGQILEQRKTSFLVIHSGSAHLKFLDDSHYPFKVNPHFNYWLPLTKNPDCFLILKPSKKPLLMYFRPVDFWHKRPTPPEGFWIDEFEVKEVSTIREVEGYIKSVQKGENSVMITEFPEKYKDWGIEQFNPQDLLDNIHSLRTIKTEYEVFCLQEANFKAAIAHQAAREGFFCKKSEYELHLLYLQSIKATENEVPYENIVALNENSATLHYHDYEKERPSSKKIHSFLIDAGAMFNGYAADVTRTYSFEKDEFQELIVALNSHQLQIIDEIKLNLPYTENHLKSHHHIAQILKDFDFVRMDPLDMVEQKVTKVFFPHGLGHFLGLQVHDVGGFKNEKGKHEGPPKDHPFLRCTRNISIGHVFTIEPGLYFIDSLLNELKSSPNSKCINWPKVEDFKKYGGIRIEDNIYMSEKGPVNLTRKAFSFQEKGDFK